MLCGHLQPAAAVPRCCVSLDGKALAFCATCCPTQPQLKKPPTLLLSAGPQLRRALETAAEAQHAQHSSVVGGAVLSDGGVEGGHHALGQIERRCLELQQQGVLRPDAAQASTTARARHATGGGGDCVWK